jgi:hypothetical protein
VSSERDPSSERKPLPLDYGRPPPARGQYAVFAAIAGFVLGIAVLGGGSALLCMNVHPLHPGVNDNKWKTTMALFEAIYGVIAAGCSVGVLRALRGEKRFFLAGFLIGIDATAMLESICFGTS